MIKSMRCEVGESRNVGVYIRTRSRRDGRADIRLAVVVGVVGGGLTSYATRSSSTDVRVKADVHASSSPGK